VARETERFLDRVQFAGDRYVRHPILLWDDWEIMLIAWQSGQITPIHDHRGVLGAMVVLSGSLAEERFSTPAGRPMRRGPTDDRSSSATAVRKWKPILWGCFAAHLQET
jgi:predicted metal-dependent enzyme (double-stranded beta helix superfamily)